MDFYFRTGENMNRLERDGFLLGTGEKIQVIFVDTLDGKKRRELLK